MSADPTKKPRSDSHLKTLPEERQAEIFEECKSKSLRDAVKWLAEDGIVTSRNSLSEFLSWYQLVNQFRQLRKDQETFMDLVKGEQPELEPSAVEAMGAAYFTTQAIKANEPDVFVSVATARNVALIEAEKLKLKKREAERKEQELELAKQKFQFDAAKACLKHLPELRSIAANPKLNQKAKINHVRQLLFGQLPEAKPATA